MTAKKAVLLMFDVIHDAKFKKDNKCLINNNFNITEKQPLGVQRYHITIYNKDSN